MPIEYKIKVLEKLKEAGYNTSRLRKEKIMGEATIQKIREGKPISWASICMLCGLLGCDVGDIIEYIPDTVNEEDKGES